MTVRVIFAHLGVYVMMFAILQCMVLLEFHWVYCEQGNFLAKSMTLR